MTKEDAIIILEAYNKWRKGEGEYELYDVCPFSPTLLDEALDLVVKTLKEKGVSNAQTRQQILIQK